VVRKDLKKQIGEIKKIYEKNFDREKFIKWKKQKNVHPNKKIRLLFFFKKIICKEKKTGSGGQGAALVASAAAPAGAPFPFPAPSLPPCCVSWNLQAVHGWFSPAG